MNRLLKCITLVGSSVAVLGVPAGSASAATTELTATTSAQVVRSGPYTGRSCGPDQKAKIWTTATGSGYVQGDYAYPGAYGGTAFYFYKHSTGSQSSFTRTKGRSVYWYMVTTTGSARVTGHGVKCQ